MRDGTFGVTGRVDPFPDPLVEAMEAHRFEPVRTLQWRNDTLDFSSMAALKASLDEPPQVEGLTKAPPADDQTALEALSRDEELADKARRPEQVKRLWEVCRLPDYRKIAPAQHAQLVGDIFGFVAGGGVVPDEWIAGQIRQANRTDGDIDTLSSRIAHIRTWTFVANQPDWLADPAAWREETKAVEDALSDALHERLTKRFVDRRTSVLMRRLRENTMLEAEITPAGDVLVEGHHVGVLSGFRFTPDPQAEGAEAQALRGAAQKALATAITDRAERLARAGDGEIVLSSDGYLRWQGEPVARLVAGDDVMKPRFVILADERLTGPTRDLVETRLTSWLSTHIATLLKPLVDLAQDQTLAGMARGIAFRLVEKLGTLDRRDVADDVRSLDQDARAGLRRHGVRFGAHHIYLPALLKPGPATLVAQLWALKHQDLDVPGLAELPAISASGRTSVSVDAAFDPEVYRRFGFRTYGKRAVRIDILERLADLIRPALAWRPGGAGEVPPGATAQGSGFVVTPAMTSLLGASGEDMAVILNGLGYRMERRPKAAVAIAPTPPAEAASAEAAVSEPAADAGRPGEPVPEKPPQEEPPVEEPSIEPPGKEPPPDAPPLEEPPPQEPPAEEPPPEEPPVREPTMPPAAAESEPTAELTEASISPAEPEMIEVWRPAPRRPKGEHRPEQRSGSRRRQRGRGPAREGERPAERPSTDVAAQGQQRERPERQEHERPPRPERARVRPDRPARPPRERPIDPDSPFAALAALKNRLEQGDRE
jgi:ATP-dependent RNA helicase SUPV3L1/SUV3